MNFADILLAWFDENHRDLPWRGESDPYKIWVSEIILQQTRVVQGIAYYHNFLAHFPDIKTLANAAEDDVLKVWQGLGYYSRARNMHAAAQSIMENHNGKFPHNYQEIRKLKGIGDYTAAAIGSIAFNLPYPAVDGNVLRFISRHFGIFDNRLRESAPSTSLPSTPDVTTRRLWRWAPSSVPRITPNAKTAPSPKVATPANTCK